MYEIHKINARFMYLKIAKQYLLYIEERGSVPPLFNLGFQVTIYLT